MLTCQIAKNGLEKRGNSDLCIRTGTESGLTHLRQCLSTWDVNPTGGLARLSGWQLTFVERAIESK